MLLLIRNGQDMGYHFLLPIRHIMYIYKQASRYLFTCFRLKIKIMAKQRQRLVEVPFNKTDCGVDSTSTQLMAESALGCLRSMKCSRQTSSKYFSSRKLMATC